MWYAGSVAMHGTAVTGTISSLARAQPQLLAIVEGRRRLTYSELDTRSNQLAHLLRSRGVTSNVLVGVHLPRSIDFIVTCLGILKAGGAYLSLDPAYPSERLKLMVRDAALGVIVTDSGGVSRFSEQQAQLLALDRDREEIDRQPSFPLDVPIPPDSLAYAIYTSGSTGVPKGVLVEHHSLSNLVSWHQSAFDITSRDRATVLSSISFDAAVWEVWPYLAAGASLHLPGEELRASPPRLRDWLIDQGITVSFLPTPLAESMLALSWPDSAPLRLLLTGADVLHRYPDAGLPFRLVNNYGPTECTVVATSGVIPSIPAGQGLPNIGKPIDHARAYILDQQLQPVLAGEVGELCIGGAGVARGYLNRPDLTEHRFVPDPFSSDPGARMYKTGDLARFLPSGDIEFGGRLDDQVKVRGYRVELGEVEWALAQHPLVEASVVVAREDVAGQRQLVAFVVPQTAGAEAELTAPLLRQFLQSRLPEYMVPSAYAIVQKLPLSASGKVDRARLPEAWEGALPRDAAPSGAGDEFQSGNVVEARVGAIVAELLERTSVNSTDNFFLMGGHSLLGAQLVARMRDAFGVEVPLRAVFDSPTVQELAAVVDGLFLAAVESLTEAEASQLLG